MDMLPYIDREECVITRDCDLEVMSNEEYPIFCGCVENDDLESDIIATQTFAISKSGIVQLKKLIPIDILYQYGHDAGSIGNLWDSHHKKFAQFIMQAQPKRILEIGGGHSKLALYCLQYAQENHNHVEWNIIEPNPTYKDDRITYIESFFTKEILEQGDYDTIIHSHTFEHIYDPHSFLADIAAASIDATCIDTTMGGGQDALFCPKHAKMARK
ncbi:class I SAM-dependent methyltransferase [Helicobacter trogontum]|uniref:class I SAM-dependent methyltransferase n=1 Tax=Helicobacter trogontum TaxID=50960 RepID=UPI001F25A45F|nr:class I SAM-dependent methyltransferase [Helicobacter trogontum]